MTGEERSRASGGAALLGLAVGMTGTVVAWGVLVLAAIDFGRDARGGASQSWLLMGGATLGAVACLFLGIIFAAKLQARVKSVRPANRAPSAAPQPSVSSAAVTEPPLPAPPDYRSRHSSAVVDPDRADTEDAPAAAYRGKRAAR